MGQATLSLFPLWEKAWFFRQSSDFRFSASWRALSGCCGQVLPRRYLYVELAMAGLVLLAWQQLDSMFFAVFIPFILLMVVIFLTDMDAFIIPDWASLGGASLGFALALLGAPGMPLWADAAFGGITGFLLIYL